MTTRIRIGTYLYLLPLHNAVQVAEDVAVVDVLSGGRFDFGIGLGYSPAEFSAYGVSLKDRGTLMEEGLAVLQGLWTREKFSFSGKHYQLKDVALTPKPVQSPHPPIWVGAFGDKAIDRAARFGCHFFGNEFVQAGFESAVQRHGGKPEQFNAGHLRFSHVAESRDEAWANVQDHLHYMFRMYAIWGGDAQADAAVAQLPPPHELRNFTGPLIGSPLVGTADDVLQGLQQLQEQTRVTDLVAGMHPPGIAPALSRRSMELFAKHVMPALR